MGFVFYDIFLRCILPYLFASNILLLADYFVCLPFLPFSRQSPLGNQWSGYITFRTPYSSSSMTFYYSRTTSSVYLLLGSRRYRFFYQPISIEATYYAWPTLKKAPTRVPTRHWFPGDYGTSQSSYVFSLLFYQGIHVAAVAFLVS